MNKKILLSLFVPVLLVFIDGFRSTHAQTFSKEEIAQQDSLKELINNSASHDTTIAESNLSLGYIWMVAKPDSGLKYCEKAIDVAEQALLKIDTSEASEVYIALKKTLSKSHSNLGIYYYGKGELEQTLKCFEKSIAIRMSIDDTLGLAITYNNMGFLNYSSGNIEKAIQYYTKSLEIDERSGNTDEQAFTLNNIGRIFQDNGNLRVALDYYHKSLGIQEKTENKRGIVVSCVSIGSVNIDQKNFIVGVEYMKRALKLSTLIGDNRGAGTALNNLGSCYNKMGLPDSGLVYYRRSLKMFEIENDAVLLGNPHNNMGAILIKKKDYEKAEEHVLKALDYFKKCDDKQGESETLINLAQIEVERGNLEKAKSHALRGLELAQSVDKIKAIKENAKILTLIYSKQGAFEKALEMRNLEVLLSDSLANEEAKKSSIQKEFQYEYDKKAAADSVENARANEVKNAHIAQQRAELKAKHNQQYALYGGLFVAVFFIGFVYNRLLVTRKQKTVIEEQSNLLAETNEELNQTNEEILAQRDQIEYQKIIVEKAHTEVGASINYAKRLQDAILPSFGEINQYIPQNFIFFKPKDIVSGDFYWFEKVGGNLFLAAADCTGHGVPGAMVSVVCANALSRCVKEFGLTKPSEILDKTRELVVETFAKSGEEVKDGMDISLVKLPITGLASKELDNENPIKMNWSGANNPIYIKRKEADAIEVVKGDREPIGYTLKSTPFKNHEIDLHSGDTIYLFSDGLPDQFGGPNNKKFGYKQFRNILIENNGKSMNEQKQKLASALNNWISKGNDEQIDDVCIIGVSV